MAGLDPNAADEYEDADLYADARLFVVPVAGSADALVAVYRLPRPRHRRDRADHPANRRGGTVSRSGYLR